jgi:hypothetical protein
MTCKWTALLLLVALVTSSVDLAFACGDKFLVNSRSANVRPVYCTQDPGRLLVIHGSPSHVLATFVSDELEPLLARVGHEMHSLSTASELAVALRAKDADVVLVDYSLTSEVVSIIASVGSHASVLPIVESEAKEQKKAAKEQFGVVLNSNMDASTTAILVNEIVRSKQKIAAAP